MAINLRPALQLTQAILPDMQQPRLGRIINVTSLVTRGLPFRTSYAASKAALESLTRTIAIEQAAFGITANAVAPGPTETELFRSNNPAGGEGEARYLSLVPLGRLGSPAEIGATISFLASDGAGFMTGQTLYVDGGASLGAALSARGRNARDRGESNGAEKRDGSPALDPSWTQASPPARSGRSLECQWRRAVLPAPKITSAVAPVPMSDRVHGRTGSEATP